MKTSVTQASLASFVQILLDEPQAAERSLMLACREVDVELVQMLKDEVDRYKNADASRARVAGELAYEASQQSAEPEAEPLGLWAMALGLTVTGDYAEALPYFEQARAAYDRIGQPENGARAAIRQVQALAMTGDLDGALKLALNVQEVFGESQLLQESGQIQISIGAIYARLGQVDNAEAALRAALGSFDKVGDRLGMAQASVNLGYALQQEDRFREALGHFETAKMLFAELGLTQSVANTTVDLALLHRKEGRLSRALELLSQARQLYTELEAESDAAYAQVEEARLRLDLNLLDEAEQLAETLVARFSGKDMLLGKAEALFVLGSARAKAGATQHALEALYEARESWLAIGNPVQAAQVDLSIAALLSHSDSQDSTAMPKALELAQFALETFTQHEVRSGQTVALLTLAELNSKQARLGEAQRQLMQAVELAEALNVPDLIIRSKRLLGQTALQSDDEAEAEAQFREAIRHLEGVRASLVNDEFKAAYVEDKTAVYGDLVDLLLKRGALKDAFEYSERAKSRALLDLLKKSVDSPGFDDDPALGLLQQQLKDARAALNGHFLAAEKEGPGGPHWQQLEQSEREVTRLTRELERLKPGDASLTQVKVPNLDEVLASLKKDSILIEYFQTGEVLAAFVLGDGVPRAIRQLGPLETINYHIERLEFFLSRVAQGGVYTKLYGEAGLKRNVDTHLKALYDLLIGPLGLEPADKRLIIVPHGGLHAVPFAALYNGQNYLIDDVQVSLAPSAAILLHCLERSHTERSGIIAFGVPVDDIPRVREEIEVVTSFDSQAEALVGEAASLASFFEKAPNANILHLATHGAYRPDNPMFSGIRLGDGWLTAQDLYGLKLGASLVVLSACETGLASEGGGDEQFGLARGFLYAGAPALTVSLWPVKDEQTYQLMKTFYGCLHQRLSAAEALRKAQLSVKAEHPNPYYWAAFALIGDPTRTI